MMKYRKLMLIAVFLFVLVLISGCGDSDSNVQISPTFQIQPETQVTPTLQENPKEDWIRQMDEMKMVNIPGGTFQMGSTKAEIENAIELCRQHYQICNRWYYERESPLHSVSLDDFWIDQTEISNAQYRLCVEAGICVEPTTCKKGEQTFNDPNKADHPVVCVNWEDAQNYCQWVGSRLPSEAEWEYAFRGTERSIYPWGDTFDGSKLNYCDANCSQSHADDRFDDGYLLTAPVGSFPSGISWSGAFNMSGNVSEWVADWFGDYSSGTVLNPLGPSTGVEKMIKGCSWFYHPTYCRGAVRPSVNPDTRFDYLGFRCASSDLSNAKETGSSTAADTTLTPQSTISQTPAAPEAVGNELIFVNSGQNFEPDRSWDVALGDLDGDGDLDAVTTNDSAEGMKVWFNNGHGIFKLSEQKLDPSLMVVLGDLDSDRDLDIVVTHGDIEADEWISGHHGAEVWLNNGSGNFAKKQEGVGGDQVFNMSLGDLNGDGYLDLFLTSVSANTVWLNDGVGNFSDTGQKLETGTDAAIAIGDLDGDGDLDALSGGWDGPPKVWLNDGTATIFTMVHQNVTRTDLHVHGISLDDFDDDGDLDAFAALANGDPHEIWINDGTGVFNPAQTLSAPLAQGVALGDIDGDGNVDAVTAHGYHSGGHIQVWLKNNDGSFTDSQLKLGDTFSSAIALGDLDNDGDLDIFATHTQWQQQGDGEQNRVWLNQITLSAQPYPGAGLLGDSFIRPTDSMFMNFVPGGAFQMGSDGEDSDAAAAEFPQHEINLDGYWIDQTEVANSQYNQCVDAGICRKSRYANSTAYNGDDYPAVGITWDDAANYCDWAGGRLPTEAEWEYAAKGESGFIYPWGNEFDGNLVNFCDVNCDENWADANFDDRYRESAPVGSFPGGASWVGALDMAGNVWEWVLDWCGEYSSGLKYNPRGPEEGTCKIIRGGTWASPSDGIRTTYRLISNEITPEIRHPNVGFRCVVPVKQEPEEGADMIIDPIVIPSGNPPTIDGTHSPGEWDDAVVETFADGSQLLIIQAEDYLYLGVRANDSWMIAGNIFINRGNEISVLHTSAALGTAIYQKSGDSWQQIQDFVWRIRSTSSSESAQLERADFLQEEGWLAANGRMGTPNELEYQLKIPEQIIRIAVVFTRSTPPYEKVPWPANLDDDCIKPTPGGFPIILEFQPDKWGVLQVTSSE